MTGQGPPGDDAYDDVDRNEVDTNALMEAGEPAVLGAAATVVEDRRRRRRQRVRHRRPVGVRDDGHGVVLIYEPHVAVVPPLGEYLRDLWERRAFLTELARSNIRGKRANTILGSLWALLDPLFMATLYYFLFSVIRGGSRSTEFVPLILAGVMHYQITSAAMTEGGRSIAGGKNLMLNSTFPRALLPLSSVYKSILQFVPALPVIFGSIVVFAGVDHLDVDLLWFFPVFAVQMLGAVGLALLLATLVVFIRDTANLMTYVARILFFSSPIIIPFDLMSDRLISILKWQPIFGVFAAYQRLYDGQRPNGSYLLISLAWAVGLFVFGAWQFLRNERRFASKI